METNRKNSSYYDEELQAVVSVYEGFLKADKFKCIANQALQLLTDKKTDRILVDTSNFMIMTSENRKWVNTEWFPEAIQAGLKKMAFLVPSDELGKISTETANRNFERSRCIIIRYFKDINEAREWLKS